MTTARERAREIARNIMDNACLSEPYISSGVDAALRESIESALASAYADGERTGLERAAEVARAYSAARPALSSDTADRIALAILALIDKPEKGGGSDSAGRRPDRSALPEHIAQPGSSEAPASPWRPIETAPKDGTPVLLGRFVADGNYDGRVRVDWWHDRMKRGYTGFGQFNPEYWPATHWMPLPPPPQPDTGGVAE